MPEIHLNIDKLADHLFRHEAGKMVSVLTRIFGIENLETAEDVVQETLLQALQVWKLKGIPENPSAWFYRVAKNKAIDIIRRKKFSVQYDFSDPEHQLLTSEYTLAPAMEKFWSDELIKDDLLRMMFACCHPGITVENQIALILKTLCGFSTAEIARTFLTPEDTISKRIYRSKEFFRDQKIKLQIPSISELKSRTQAVLNAIYLLFSEGYNSARAEDLIRQDLLDEAFMLVGLLLEYKETQLPETYALMALMCFHAARTESRLSAEGEIILLPDQDRSKWNQDLIKTGNHYMNQAAFGEQISTYHLEAAIAYEHCTAQTFTQTNWNRILFFYNWLCNLAPSPVTELNKAIAILQVHGPAMAMEALNKIPDQQKLGTYYLYHSFLGTLYTQLGHLDKARQALKTALKMTRSEAERKMLLGKIADLLV